MPDAPAMLPLAGPAFPHTSQELREALSAGLKEQGLSPRSVTVDGGEFPSVDRLKIDLTGATVTRTFRIAPSTAISGEEVRVGALEISAAPLRFEEVPAHLHLEANDARLVAGSTATGSHLLTLQNASTGSLVIEAQRTDLESLLRTTIAALASEHGVEVKDVRLTLDSHGPRALGFRAVVVVKMMFVKTELTVSGDARLDDDLNLWISNLALTGGGMAATLASGFIRPHFAKVEGRPISLQVLALGNLRLRDVELKTGETVRLSARFSA